MCCNWFAISLPPTPSSLRLTFSVLGLLGVLFACVNEYDPAIRANVDVVIVEATLTDLPEIQFVKLSRSKSDSLTGRFGSVPLTGATVTIAEDSSRVLALKETAGGRYELPTEFRGRVGSRYQLRFQLRDGTRYESTTETLRADERESVVGYFAVSSVSKVYYWLDRKNNSGSPIGLSVALHGRKPITAGFVTPPSPCLSAENRTPFKPQGWRE